MLKRVFSAVMFILLLANMLTLAFNIQPVKASPMTITVPDDYATIQEAIDAANEGDTVFARNGKYYENIYINKALSLIGEDRDTTIIDGSKSGGYRVIDIRADSVRVSGFTIQNGSHSNIMIWSNNNTITGNRISNNTWMGGIYVQYGANNTIQNNILSNNGMAINLYWGTSVNNNVANNSIMNNDVGISVWYSKNNVIAENTLSNNHAGMEFSWDSVNNTINSNLIVNNEYGIHFSACSGGSILRNNNMLSNKYSLIVDGWSFSDYLHDIDISNTINGKPIYYLVNQKNKEIPSNAGYVGAVGCENIVVRGQNLSNSGQGIMFADTTASTVEDVDISNNYYGIYLIYSSNNMVFHNNFINNTNQVWSYYSTNTWDYGYPVGGNYWSDYNGTDRNSDGIGDIHYVIDRGNEDRYPIMNLRTPAPPAEHDLATSITAPTFQRLSGSSTLDAIVMNRGLNDEVNVQLSLVINGTTVNSITIPLLEVDSSSSFSYLWTPTSQGTYNITLNSPPVFGETLTDNNIATFLVTVATSLRVPEYAPSIQMAIDIANPGDTISVSPGIYYENILVTKDGLSLIGSGADLTIIDGQDKYNVIYAYEVTSFTIEGFTVRNSSHTGSTPGSVGIHINPDYLWGGNFAIRRCKIQDNWDGVAVWTHEWGTVIIENNIISNNYGNGIDASYPIGNGEAVIRCNTIVHNGRNGYYDFAGGGYRTIVNNIITSNDWYGILSHPSTSKHIAYNNVWNNTGGSYYENPGWGEDTPFAPSPGTGEISADPLFVDTIDRNYSLSEGSPCIDAGTNANASGVDLEGKPRPIDGDRNGIATVDMGAYEFAPRARATMALVNVADGSGNFSFSSAQKSVGDTFVVNITITGAGDLGCWQVGVQWDSSLLSFAAISVPSDNVFAGKNPVFAGPDTSVPGLVVYGGSAGSGENGFTGNGTLAQLTLQITQGVGPSEQVESDIAFESILVDTFLLNSTGSDVTLAYAFNNAHYTYVGQQSETMLGDLNQDGIVNILDAIQAASAFGSYPGDPRWNEQADINRDGVVNILDVIILANNFGKH